jgi:hypothetical protein
VEGAGQANGSRGSPEWLADGEVDDKQQPARSGERSCSSMEDRGMSRLTELRKRGGHGGSSPRREESGSARPKQATWVGLWRSPASRQGQKAGVG